MEIIGLAVLVIVFAYLIINRSRNTDPLNRKCAAEICEYLVSTQDIDPEQIKKIFENNARYQKQALHIVSMIPTLLMSAGIPNNNAMSIVPILQIAAFSRPK